MPTGTFYRLNKDKQAVIIKAAKDEFSRVPFHDAAISNIVKNSGISRGSFYQYFEDKEDIFFYCLVMLREESESYYLKLIDEKKGDFFDVNLTFFNYFAEDILMGNNSAFYKNMFLNMDYKSSMKMFSTEKRQEQQSRKHLVSHEMLAEKFDTSKLKINSEEELKSLFQLVVSMIMLSINHAFKKMAAHEPFDVEETKHQFASHLQWLRYGVERKND
ncbi:TetR/AcrR family transcriptional regulator [Vagococcus vulneris]|uniref:HTH tetR-type domain-containing protein n=1 Tax=Vagococcus vulneris TaxID=1977869 RepID=A0A429ZWD4_9ENTE|nr:TetR/AcrR family transcriptional regulator [Vagococcus vulneris]RST98073.1 hypothetical protein CBF37_09225 [Vagococcus vulneris]